MVGNDDGMRANDTGRQKRGINISGAGNRSTQNQNINTDRARLIQEAQRIPPRPFHPQPSLNETPDETEPSSSYESRIFYVPDAAEAFHDDFSRRLKKGRGSGASGFADRGLGSDNNRGGSSEWWRTSKRQAQNSASSSLDDRCPNASDGSEAPSRGVRNKNCNNKNRSDNTALGRQSFECSDKSIEETEIKKYTNEYVEEPSKAKSKRKGVGAKKSVEKNEKIRPTERSASSSSLASTGSNRGDAKKKSKQLNEARLSKYGAQVQAEGDDNGYFREGPTIGRNRNDLERSESSVMIALEEEMSRDTCSTDDGYGNYDNLTGNDGSHTCLHSNLNGAASSIQNERDQQQRLHPTSLTPVADREPLDNQRSLLTQHIYSQPSTPPSLHVPDNTDNRSTTSTMSDLSTTDTNTNSRQLMTSTASGSSQQYEFHTQLRNTQHPQHFSNVTGGGFSPRAPNRLSNDTRSSSQQYEFHTQLRNTQHPQHFSNVTGGGFSPRAPNRLSNDTRSSENGQNNSRTSTELKNIIAAAIHNCEGRRFRLKKKLILENLNMTAPNIPVNELYNTVLGQTLYKLSLKGNRLQTIPRKLVTCLPLLKTMDISQCNLHQLPERWNLPQLRRLILSHNRLTDFPEETMLEGLLELEELNMFGNEVSMIIIPHNPKLLSRLEILDLGFNELVQLPEELDRVKSLKTLKVINNCLEVIPMRVCNMNLNNLDVSNNPVRQPPIETCERGIGSMRRFYRSISGEDSIVRKQYFDKVKDKQKKGKRASTKRTSSGRRHSDGSSQSSNSKIRSSQNNQDKRLSAVDAKSSTIVSTISDSNVANKHVCSGEIVPSNLQVQNDEATINETLKVIFVGMAEAGKTSMIRRLIKGEDAVIPKQDQRTIGVDIYKWDPTSDKRYEHIDNRILVQDEKLEELCPNANVKFSVWDFAGQQVYHATHELFFSPRALYVVVWNMAAKKISTKHSARKNIEDNDYDSEDDESDNDDERKADRALEHDIDENVQFWIDCIQSSVPGAVILPVATFDDYFGGNNHHEAKRRCDMLKQRLQKHEARSIKGIQDRLEKYRDENRAGDEPALRLLKLLQSNSRPKIIFGDQGENSVVRVSGTKYTGFAKLTEKIINIATGRDTAKHKKPLFNGHIGVRIPRMRLTVRNIVREMRQKFEVIDWGLFFQELQKNGINDIENASDALHFLSEVGELSYFGNFLPDTAHKNSYVENEMPCADISNDSGDNMTTLTDEDENGNRVAFCTPEAISKVTRTKVGIDSDNNIRKLADLSQFVFLNPKWLVQAVACILRHDLDYKIHNVRRSLGIQYQTTPRPTFDEATTNCPVISSDDAYMLWQYKQGTKKAVELVEEASVGTELKPFDFLQLLLLRFRIFIPIDLGIDKAVLGGIEYSQKMSDIIPHQNAEMEYVRDRISSGDQNRIDVLKSTYFFLPSLLGELKDMTGAWSYRTVDAYKATLCHSFLFEDGVPPGMMERITAFVLNNIYAITQGQGTDSAEFRDNTASNRGSPPLSPEGIISVKEVLCWRNAFILKLKYTWKTMDGKTYSSIDEIFTTLVGKDSNYCVGSSKMSVGSKRLVTTCKGMIGDGGKKIWKGGYLVVLRSIMKVVEEYGGAVFEKHAFCPECLGKNSVSEASFWDFEKVERMVKEGERNIRCHHAHNVDIRLVCPLADLNENHNNDDLLKGDFESQPVSLNNDYLRGVVLIGLWDGDRIIRVGSGFIVDAKLGLIVTASHTLMNVDRRNNDYDFGVNYFGVPHGKVVIGILPQEGTGDYHKCVFRYFAKIVEKDPSLKKGICRVDACVLSIITRMENDVEGEGEECGKQHEQVLQNNTKALKDQKLVSLNIAKNKPQREEDVTIIGYSQGGESLLVPGTHVNRDIGVQKGYVNGFFRAAAEGTKEEVFRTGAQPREEIIVECETICGQSGGPCVNRQKEVVGILSRADIVGSRRCYVVPIGEIEPLITNAKNSIKKVQKSLRTRKR